MKERLAKPGLGIGKNRECINAIRISIKRMSSSSLDPPEKVLPSLRKKQWQTMDLPRKSVTWRDHSAPCREEIADKFGHGMPALFILLVIFRDTSK